MSRNYDLTKVINKTHENKWVALTPTRDKVIGSSESLLKLRNQIGSRAATYMKIVPANAKRAF